MQNSQTNTFLKGMNLDTAKEFISSDQYIDALDVHINTDNGATAGALQPYVDIELFENKLGNHTVLGTTIGHIYTNSKTNCYIVLSYGSNGPHLESVDIPVGDYFCISVFDEDLNILQTVNTRKLQLDPLKTVKLINLYEDSTRSRVYITQEDQYIQVVNINVEKNYYNNHTDFSIFPQCGAMPPLRFSHIVKGNKTAGKVQYAYQLFGENGETTALSAVSHMIPVGSELSDNLTDEGIVVTCDYNPSFYKYVRIYEIRYTNYSDVPRIFIKDEFECFNKITYADTSDKHLSEITIEQFQAIKSFQFKTSTAELKDNRLFVANVLQNTFDVEYDARVYSADENGLVKYTSTDGSEKQFYVDSINAETINKTEIVNNVDPNTYKYGFIGNNDKRILGGLGLNVSYEFICPILIAESNNFSRPEYGSDTDKSYGFKNFEMLLPSTRTASHNVSQYTGITLLSGFYNNCDKNKETSEYVEKFPHSSVEEIDISNNKHKIKTLSYSDTYVSSNYVGFKQGECYTFGIVFYNTANIPSPVHYVGTIHIPYLNNTYSVYQDNDGNVHDLAVMPIGIRFKIKTNGLSEQGVVAYEIVREQKTVNNRKILCQGILSNMYPAGKHEFSIGDSDLRFPIFPTIGQSMKTVDNYTHNDTDNTKGQYEHILNSKYVSVVSPEISINKSNFQQNLKLLNSMKLVKVLYSFMADDEDLYKKIYTNIKGGYEFGSNGAYPIAKHFTYATAPSSQYTVNGKTYHHYKVFGTTSFTYTGYSDQEVEGMPLKNAHDSMAYGLFKYYVSSALLPQYTLTNTNAVFCETLPQDTVGKDSSSFTTQIDQKSIVNMSLALGAENGYETFGGHCNCVVVYVGNDNDVYNTDALYKPIRLGSDVYGTNYNNDWNYTTALSIPSSIELDHINRPSYVYNYNETITSQLTDFSENNTLNIPGTFVVDLLTGYIPNISYSDISTITYTSFGNYFKITEDEIQTNDVFGGDTYMCIHKELWSGYGYDSQHKLGEIKARASVNIKYPVETRINLDRVTGPNYDSVTSDSEKLGLMFEPGTNLLGQSQQLPLNEYNDAYSAQEYNKLFVSKGMYDIENQHNGNRILVSEVKSIGELSDSFQDFRIANYLDVDGQYGDITNLVKYNGRLYYLQYTAFGTVSVNERSLITDNNNAALLLGTGDVLQRYDYISTFDGTYNINDNSIVVSPSSLYWYDSQKHQYNVFNQGGLNSLSKVKNVQSYFNKLDKDVKVHSGYDSKYNELWISSEDNSESIIYSEQIQAFVGRYSNDITHSVTFGDFALALNSNKQFIKFGKCPTAHKYNKEPYVEFVVNKDLTTTKTYDTLMFTDTLDKHGNTAWFTANFNTNRQGDATINFGNSYKEGVYYVAVGRDFNKERMRDKTMTVKLTFGATEFSIPQVSTIFRYSRA